MVIFTFRWYTIILVVVLVLIGCSNRPAEGLDSLQSKAISLGFEAKDACGETYADLIDTAVRRFIVGSSVMESNARMRGRNFADTLPGQPNSVIATKECSEARQSACDKAIEYLSVATDEDADYATLPERGDVRIVGSVALHCMDSDYRRASRAYADAMALAV